MTGRTTSSRRQRRAAPLHADTESSSESAIEPLDERQPASPTPRDLRFVEKVRNLRVGTTSVKLEEHLLMVIGGVLAPLGLVVVLLGWWGAAHTPHLFEQLPYVISGGLFGLGLIFLGSFLYFTHWVTQLVKEHRAQSAALLDAIGRLEEKIDGGPSLADDAVTSNGTGGAATWVATQRGTMAHRPDCVVVAGKPDLRSVSEADGLDRCKLCAV